MGVEKDVALASVGIAPPSSSTSAAVPSRFSANSATSATSAPSTTTTRFQPFVAYARSPFSTPTSSTSAKPPFAAATSSTFAASARSSSSATVTPMSPREVSDLVTSVFRPLRSTAVASAEIQSAISLRISSTRLRLDAIREYYATLAAAPPAAPAPVPVPIRHGELITDRMQGGNYKEKYLKYKAKYLALKNNII